jgi:uncharacterized protein (UPF0303 family)
MPTPENQTHQNEISKDLARIALQEQQLQFANFNEGTAWQLGAHLREFAAMRNLGIVIDVRRINQPLFYAAMPGTTPDNVEWVRRKTNVTLRYHRSSYAIGLEMEQKNSNIYDRYGLPIADFVSHGGCFPIRAINAGLIGAVTVSGLPQRADHELVVEALCTLIGRDYDALRLA